MADDSIIFEVNVTTEGLKLAQKKLDQLGGSVEKATREALEAAPLT